MIIEYKEMSPDAMTAHDTYIIAFCPDTNEFFISNQRCFFWEFATEFQDEKEAIKYFENNIDYFASVMNRLMSEFCLGYSNDNKIIFNGKLYEI